LLQKKHFVFSGWFKFTNGAAMKRTNGISPAVWSVGVIVIAAAIFFAWIGSRQHRAAPQPKQSPQPIASTETATSGVHRVNRNQDFNSSDSQPSAQLEETRDNAVQIGNEDHALKGIVTTAEGVPVVGASVAAVSGEPSMSVRLQGSHFRSFDQHIKLATTDDSGAFSLSSPPEHGTVMAVADAGFASASIDQFRATQVLVLQAFGRIEGTLKIAGAPGVGQEISYDPPVFGLSADFNIYKTKTDDQGHFALEKIPPGEGYIARVIKISRNASTQSLKTPVTVQPGQTAQVTLGDSGAVLRGSVRFESPTTNGDRLTLIGRVSRPRPKLPAFKSIAEANAYFGSPEGQALTKNVKEYPFAVNADGTFQVDSVASGTYTIEVSAQAEGELPFINPPIAQGSIQFTVPDNPDPFNAIGVGEITLISARVPATGMLLRPSLIGL
jgi:hypothetical protein